MKKHSVKTRVMDFVYGKGEASYSEIVRFLVEEVKNIKYASSHRGYYSGAFSGNNPYFLHSSKNEPRYLEKSNFSGKYRVINPNKQNGQMEFNF